MADITQADLDKYNRDSWAAEPMSNPANIFGPPDRGGSPAEQTFAPPADEPTAFDELAEGTPTTTTTPTVNPVTRQIAGIALARGEPVSGEDELLAVLARADAAAEQVLKEGKESLLRSEIALDRATRKHTELRMNIPKYTDTPAYGRGKLYGAQVAGGNLETQMKSAMEREAIETIQDLAAAGDYTQARILANRLRPENADVVGVWQDNMAKSLILSQMAARAKQADDNEGWLSAIYTGLVSMFQPSAFSYLGNVNDGVGGYKESGGFKRFFHPGSELQKQAQAIWNMSPEELSDYRPTLEANIRSNATNLGVVNPDKMVELLGLLQSPLTDDAAKDMSAISNFENAAFVAPGIGVVPYKLAGKAISLPFTMIRAGARKEAGNQVAAAFETLVREGPEATMARHGLDEETIMDNMMPDIINPEKGGPAVNVSLSGDANTVSAAARELAEKMNLSETERLASPEEITAAMNATVEEVAARYGTAVKDIKFSMREEKLADGTHTRVLEAVLGDPRTGGLFATEAEAIGWRMSHGFDNGVVRLEEGAVRTVHPREQGFTDVVYHGTTKEIKGDFKPSEYGVFGKDVVYTTPDLDYSHNYARSFVGRDAPEGSNIHPLLINGQKNLGFAQRGRSWTAAEVKKTYKELGLKMSPYTKDLVKGLDGEQFIAEPYDRTMDGLALAANKRTATTVSTMEEDWNALRRIAEAKGYHGHTSGFGGISETVIYDPANLKSIFERTTVQDPSGGYANIIEMDIPETAFYTHMEGKKQGAMSRLLRNTSETLDENLYGKANVADQKFNRMSKMILGEIHKAYAPLTKNERMWLGQILLKGENANMWFTPEQFSTLVERSMGKAPSDRMIHAYESYHVLNDFEFALRNDGVYRDKVIRGMESVKFNAFDEPFDFDGFINYNPIKAPRDRVYNITDDIHYVGDKTLSDKAMKELSAKGYIYVRLEKPVKLKDGTSISHFVGKQSDFAISRLRKDQLGYKPGGHRIYESRYQVKQASWIEQPDTGQKSLQNPNVFVMAPTIKDARRWAATMNAARVAVKNGEGAEYLDQFVFKGDKGFPKGEEFVQKVESGFIDKNEPFEALYDRDVPSAYKNQGVDLEGMLGEEAFRGGAGYHRTTGRMYYSGKGEHMLDHTGDLAPTIDPFEAQSRALFNAARLSASFGDFKVSAMERWVNKYRGVLNIRGLPEDQAKSSYAIFNKAQPMDGIDFDLKQQLLGQRESIKRILGFQTENDLNYRHWMRSTAEWIIGDSDNILREKASKGVFWLYDNNPVTFLRGLAFDMKLGLFNVGQFFIQASTMASAIALNPKHGKFGLQSAVGMMAFFLKKGDENVLDTLTKRGVHKLAGFADEAEYKQYAREALKSGFFDLGDSHIMVNDMGPEKFVSSITGGVQQAREMGRWFFYNVEVMNRLTAHRIAYGEALERFGKADWDNFQFREFIARRSENYSFNMSNASKSWWQTGLLSIPTQFWAYNVRMLEALLGSNFTAAQKVRLLGMQWALAGTAGVPVVAGISDLLQTHYGITTPLNDENTLAQTIGSTMERGLADFMVSEMFGADVTIGERWGTGSWSSDLLRDIFGYSKFNNKTFAEIVGGATYSITTGALGVLGDALPVALKWMTAESGAEELDMTSDEITKLFRQISTVNNTLHAWEVYNYGIYTSSKGKVLASDLPTTDALFAAAGFAPGELNDLGVMSNYVKNRNEVIADAAKQIVEWKQEALTRPDLLESNSKKVNAFVKFLPPDIKMDVLRKAHRDTDPSIYIGIKDRFDKTRRKEEMLNRVNNSVTNAEGQ